MFHFSLLLGVPSWTPTGYCFFVYLIKILIINVINIVNVLSVGDSKCTVEGTTEGHTEGHAGGNMVVVKVRETYDLHTVKNKMTVIAIHTPRPSIIKANYPGLLMQCKAYRPLSADVRVACASVEPLDPKGIGTEEGDVAPEDIFNPILYKPVSNFGMSQLEARIAALLHYSTAQIDVDGATAAVDVDTVTTEADEFNVYYGLLSNTHEWKHASPQSGFSMSGLRPLVYEMLYNIGDNSVGNESSNIESYSGMLSSGSAINLTSGGIRGNAKPMPFINTTAYSYTISKEDPKSVSGYAESGFPSPVPANCELTVPWLNVICGVVIIPPSRLHSLYFRLVCEWSIEFSTIRPISEITNWGGLALVGSNQHYQNYSYETVKEALTGSSDSIVGGDACMVSSNVDVTKVM